jgi:hypothetical protein
MSDPKSNDRSPKPEAGGNPPHWLELVSEQVASIRFGTVVITVQDSRVVQVDKLEKLRIDPPKNGPV